MRTKTKAGGPLKHTQIWYRVILKILEGFTQPISGGSLINLVKAKIIADQITDPSDPSKLVACPDKSYIDWMVKQRIINKYNFKDRQNDYYGRGVSVNYEYAPDSVNCDLPILSGVIMPSPTYSNSGASTPAPVAVQQPGITPGRRNKSYDVLEDDVNVLIASYMELKKRIDLLELQINGIREEKEQETKTKIKTVVKHGPKVKNG